MEYWIFQNKYLSTMKARIFLKAVKSYECNEIQQCYPYFW